MCGSHLQEQSSAAANENMLHRERWRKICTICPDKRIRASKTFSLTKGSYNRPRIIEIYRLQSLLYNNEDFTIFGISIIIPHPCRSFVAITSAVVISISNTSYS